MSLFGDYYPGIRRVQNVRTRVDAIMHTLGKEQWNQDDWTGVSGLADYMMLRQAVGLPFDNGALVANVIKASLKEDAKDWDSSRLGPIDAADALVQSQEARFRGIADSIRVVCVAYDKQVGQAIELSQQTARS